MLDMVGDCYDITCSGLLNHSGCGGFVNFGYYYSGSNYRPSSLYYISNQEATVTFRTHRPIRFNKLMTTGACYLIQVDLYLSYD